MQRLLTLFLFALLILPAGCKKDSPNPVSPPPVAEVRFTMHLESGSEGMVFVARASDDVKLTRVIASYPAEQFVDTIDNPQPDRIFPKNSDIRLNEYTGISTHQQWVIIFHGTIATTGKQFVVTVNWDVV